MNTNALLAIIAGHDTDSLIEIRCRRPNGGIAAREWFPVGNHEACRRFVASHAPSLDVYVGAAPRIRREGGKAAIHHAWCLWVDIDTPEALAALRAYPIQPSLIVHSGTGDNIHAWWAISDPLPPVWVERANRRLAFALGADMKATDAARILRPPGTLNHKHDPPVRVTCDLVTPGIHYPQVRESVALPVFHLVKNLPDPPMNPPARRRPRQDTEPIDPLLGISADHYYANLTGREITRGNVTCPFHKGGNEQGPSMRLYATTFHCFGCQASGSIYQFGALLYEYSLPLRGDAFKEVRERLQREMGVI